MKTRATIIMNLLFCAGLFLLVPTFPALAGEPPKGPILRLESGMHTAPINRIGVDLDNHFLVTASNDKTVRVWELPGLRLVKILRPPLGEGHEGKIFAVAISPDGNTIAAAGVTGFEWEKKTSIYLFDRTSGWMTRPKGLQGLPHAVKQLVYSRDGRFLVAGLGGHNGIRTYRTAEYTPVKEDPDYGDDVYGADFSRDGRLVTVSYDGLIRLYDESFTRIRRVQAPGGKGPHSTSFSPDGTMIAVGYRDTTRVDVLSGKDLAYLFSPNTNYLKEVKSSNLRAVAWSTDGSLYAGGSYRQHGRNLILKWTGGDRGHSQALTASSSGIQQILPLKDGGIAFGAYDPAFGIFDYRGIRTHYMAPEIADFRGPPESFQRFLISHDGATVQFGFEIRGEYPARFAIKDRLLTRDPSEPGSLNPPSVRAAGLEITDWFNSSKPKLNGRPLKFFNQYELSRSLAVCPDGQCFFLGTNFNLRLFDKKGINKWGKPIIIPIPGPAWSVNIAGDGRVGVATLGDGTIRWYRMTDGKELLAFFPHKDRKRWVLWTPSGYYDASVNGENLIGWHVNRGPDQAADFFPVSRFRDVYYRPDIVARVLTTLDETEAIRWANASRGTGKETPIITKILPPVITIVQLSSNTISTASQTVTLRYRVRSPSDAQVTSVRALVNARPVPTPKGVPVKSGDKDFQEITIPIPEEDCEISLLAENRNGLSVPDTIRVLWKGKPPVKSALRRLFILAVGIGNYEDKDLKLRYAAKDAEDFTHAFKQQEGLVYSEVFRKVITDAQAKKDDILDGLDWLKEQVTSRDIAIIFFSGHGINDPTGLYYFLPQNAVREKLTRTGLELSTIKNIVSYLPSKVLIFLDTCHAGSTDFNGIINTLIGTGVGAVVFASSTGTQTSWESVDWKNGAFTKAMVEGINGAAEYKGKITFTSLDLYVSDRVKKLTNQKQTPVVGKPLTIADFEIAKKR